MQVLSERLYMAHLECMSQWQGMWPCIETPVNKKNSIKLSTELVFCEVRAEAEEKVDHLA